MLCHEHCPNPFDEEFSAGEGDSPAEVRLLLRPLHGDAPLNERDVQVVGALTFPTLATEIPKKWRGKIEC